MERNRTGPMTPEEKYRLYLGDSEMTPAEKYRLYLGQEPEQPGIHVIATRESPTLMDRIREGAAGFLAPQIESQVRKNLRPIALFLISEGLASWFLSKDQRPLSQVGRATRIYLGARML